MNIQISLHEIKQMHQKMLELLKCFIHICEDNNLRYWLGGGTCLGAVRHKGFIPWDDDVDVFMPRPDYEKLYNIWNNLSIQPNYILCKTTENKNYHHRVMQLLDTSTTFINKRNMDEDIEHGIYIDIIPMDAAAKSLLGRFKQRINAVIYSVFNIQCVPEFQGGLIMRTCVKTLLIMIKSPKNRYNIWKNAERRMSKYNWENCDYTIELTTSFSSIFKLWKREWFETEKLLFEDIEAEVPKGRDEYMSIIYGDYMQFPPLDKQVARHNTVFMNMEESYTKYRGIYYLVKKV